MGPISGSSGAGVIMNPFSSEVISRQPRLRARATSQLRIKGAKFLPASIEADNQMKEKKIQDNARRLKQREQRQALAVLKKPTFKVKQREERQALAVLKKPTLKEYAGVRRWQWHVF